GICPVDAPVTTNSITRIRHGDKEYIEAHVDDANGNRIVQAISRDEIATYVAEGSNSGNNRNVRLLDIRIPSSRLKDGLVLYDTPGVGSLNVAHTSTTYGIIPFADAVVFVGAANEPLSTPELRFLKDISRHKPLLLHVLTKRDTAGNATEILRTNLEKIAATLEAPADSVQGVSFSSRRWLQFLDDNDPDTLAASGIQELEAALWKVLANGGDMLIGRLQGHALTALSQVRAPLEAEYASLAATTKSEIQALDARLRKQEERGKELMTGSQDWSADLGRRGRNLSSALRQKNMELFDAIQQASEAFLEDPRYRNNPEALSERLRVECTNGFVVLVKEANQELGRIVQDLRASTDLNPTLSGIAADASFGFNVLPTLPVTSSRMERVSQLGTTVARNTGAFAALGGILGGVVGTIVPVAGTIAGAQIGSAIGMAIGTLFGAKKGIGDLQTHDTEMLKRSLAQEIHRQIQQARAKASSSLEIFMTDSTASIESSLRVEIRGALDACGEARAELAKKRSEDMAVRSKELKEKETLIRTMHGWGNTIADILPSSQKPD
nr:dynamin family protein [Fibrobacteria bacterium]